MLYVLFAETYKCVQVPIPASFDEHSPERIVELRASGRSLNANYTFDEKTQVYTRKPQFITFIQTDKPKYKPGQEGMAVFIE